jgi:hypothetical protein
VLVEIQLVSCPGGCGVYARDDRPWSGPEPPAAVYFYSFDRKAERPAAHLQDFRGVLQVDAGFERLASNRICNTRAVSFFWTSKKCY